MFQLLLVIIICEPVFCRVRLRPCLPFYHTFHAGAFRGGKITSYDRRANGVCLCGDLSHAADFRVHRKPYRRFPVPRLLAGNIGTYGRHAREELRFSAWRPPITASYASLAALPNSSMISATCSIFFVRQAFSPQNTSPCSKSPFTAWIKASVMQYGMSF